jgi:LysM repeat protein
MSFFGKWNPVLLAAAFFAAAGCSPLDQGAMDEEKEPHYVLGKSRVNAFNYTGAIEAFEESLEANPHSALAHYQLAMLFENQESDPAAAIYHYQQYLKYNPKAANAEIIAQHITRCKQQLAEDSLTLPSTPAAQQQLEKLMDENRQLHTQLSQWQAAYFALKTNPPVAPVNNVAPQNNFPPQPQATSATPDDVTTAATAPSRTTATGSKPAPAPQKTAKPARTHTVARGETLASIARGQSLSLTALEAANPGVNPKKLKAGQVLNLPPP